MAQKAYAQWNETGKEGRDGENAYASIHGGWMATVDAQVLGYNASTDTFTLYNPWGSNQPGPFTWSQLQATCSRMAVADTSGSVPFAIGATGDLLQREAWASFV